MKRLALALAVVALAACKQGEQAQPAAAPAAPAAAPAPAMDSSKMAMDTSKGAMKAAPAAKAETKKAATKKSD